MNRIIAGMLALMILAACGPSEEKVATAIAETEAARPTETLTPTQISSPTPTITPTSTFTPTSTLQPPTQTARPTAFQMTFTDTSNYLIGDGFTGPAQVACTLKQIPVWVDCDTFAYLYKDELSQIVEVLHDGESVVGIIVVFDQSIAAKYPNDVTAGFGLLWFSLDFGLPQTTFIEVPDLPEYIRVDDFVLAEFQEGDLSAYIYLDILVADDIF